MDILSDKIVKTRKPHICSACSRRFEAGSKMRRQVNNGDGLVTWYECETCIQLLTRHRKEFDDGYNVCWMNCVDDSLERGQTPEDLLRSLDERKLKDRVLPISDVSGSVCYSSACSNNEDNKCKHGDYDCLARQTTKRTYQT